MQGTILVQTSISSWGPDRQCLSLWTFWWLHTYWGTNFHKELVEYDLAVNMDWLYAVLPSVKENLSIFPSFLSFLVTFYSQFERKIEMMGNRWVVSHHLPSVVLLFGQWLSIAMLDLMNHVAEFLLLSVVSHTRGGPLNQWGFGELTPL